MTANSKFLKIQDDRFFFSPHMNFAVLNKSEAYTLCNKIVKGEKVKEEKKKKIRKVEKP